MARWPSIFLAAVYLLNTALQVQGVKYLVTVPKKPRYDSEIKATVTAVGIPEGETKFLNLEYTGAKDTSRTLDSTVLEFRKDGMETWGVVFPWKRLLDLGETGVRLSVENTKYKTLQFHRDSGYIFIQTDKPVYTPRQTVKFRIIAVDEYQRLATYQVRVDIKNPEGVIVDRMRYSADEAFNAKEFELPREANMGNWSISASFEGSDNTYSSAKTVNFEVKEYVLPRFSAGLEKSTDVVTRDTEWISLYVSASYVYGRAVHGTTEMQIGVWNEQDGVRLLPEKYRGELEDGKFQQDIRMTVVFPLSEPFPENQRLYIAVNVTEKATGENDTIIDTSMFMSHPYYVVSFDSSDMYVKPGFPYTLKADVASKTGRKANWVQLYIITTFVDQDNNTIADTERREFETLDKSARLVKVYDTPAEADKIYIKVMVLDYARNSLVPYSHVVTKYETKTDYIHLSLDKAIKSRQNGKVLIQYTKRKPEGPPTYITLQVLAKGEVVFTYSVVKNEDGRTTVDLPRNLYRIVTPSMRIIAYYYARVGDETEFVVDSLLVDTKDVCVEEVSLKRPGGRRSTKIYKPKDGYEMQIKGKGHMRVGLVSVDEAVFLVNNRQTLTRESFFEQMGSHDQGNGEGDGKDFKEILTNTGLDYLVFDTEEEAATAYSHLFEKHYDMILPSTTGIRIGHGNNANPAGVVPPQTIRKYFPEAWLFEEKVLPGNGRMNLNLTLPDSITTWNFLAVGLSKHRGVCVSKPLREEVQKQFFADIRLPYKATRLEELKVKIAIYNYKDYAQDITGYVSGVGEGLCFSANSARGSDQDRYKFSIKVEAKDVGSHEVKVIPLKNGELTLRVDLTSQNERDVVERKIFVVAEGLRMHKSITFVLDPEATHVTYNTPHHDIINLTTSATVNNIFDVKKKEQNTTIDLALPVEIIHGTEVCRISAFGDLMGDIITHAIVESRSLVEQPLADAEEVLGDLGPTVHALIYVNKSGLADENIAEKGRRFISHSVARLLKYHKRNYFTLTERSPPATWLTATVLKTLCHASELAFVDDQLINDSFNWISGLINPDGGVQENDRRLSKASAEYDLMLSAEVLISLIECERFDEESHLALMAEMENYLATNIFGVSDPMVMAKATYGLTRSDEYLDLEETSQAIERLWALRKVNDIGHIYWSSEYIVDHSETSTPFWYQLGAEASSIEATAYALLVFLRQGGRYNVDAIADWLVGQRNENGAFVGAMDSTAAIQALSDYSLTKRGFDIDLSCNVSSDKSSDAYTHSFKFTQKNAIRPEDLNNVPVGHKLEVLTKGKGLGQMHVNVEYNIPVDKNAHCNFNVSVVAQVPDFNWLNEDSDNPLCKTCNIGCDEAEKPAAEDEGLIFYEPMPIHSASRVGRSAQAAPSNSRKRRDLRNLPAASKRSICIHVCVRHLKFEASGPTTIELEMLTGYIPFDSDVERLRELPDVRNVAYDNTRDVLAVQFDSIPNIKEKCFGIRAIDEYEVGKPTPASVVVRESMKPEPSCFLEYNPVAGEESLQVFCADFANSNRGECRCFSGICSSCLPEQVTDNTMTFHTVQTLACHSEIAYELELSSITDQSQWVEIDATVIARNKTGSHEVHAGESIRLITPSSCYCPHYSYQQGGQAGDRIYLLSPDVEKLVDRTGSSVYRYLLDEKSHFLRVTENTGPRSSDFSPAAPHLFLESALKPGSC